MAPMTRNQLKKSSHKTEPYSKENRPSDRRTALSDLVIENVVKTVTSSVKEEVIKNSNEIVCSKDNITTTENASGNSILNYEFPKPIIVSKPKKISITKEPTRLSLNDSNASTNASYQTANESISSKYSASSDELYTTAVSSRSSMPFEVNNSELYHSTVQELTNCKEEEIFETDQAHWNDYMYVGCYARDIFKYLRQREDQFNVADYISTQSELTPRHRAIVVNWLVNLQEIYGLNHEVLYMAVKLIDLYLSKNKTSKDNFQLLASGAILIASKIDEREPGFPYDLVKQCKYIYTEDELFSTEREIIKALNYDINFPLSYVFLRRFARCMMCQMFLLTLARYILECSLLNYSFVFIKDSLKAAGALYLAFKMCSKSTDATEFKKFTGYGINEIKRTVIAFNNMLHKQCPDLCAVKQKYLHETFYKVASKALLSNKNITFD